MVCFTTSEYKLTPALRLLIPRYLEGIRVNVKKDDGIIGGSMGPGFLDDVPDGETVTTERFWSGHVSSQVLPVWNQPPAAPNADAASVEAAEWIDSTIGRRLSLDGNELFLYAKFQRKLDCGILPALGLIKRGNSVQRWFYSPAEEKAVLLIRGAVGHHAIEVTATGVWDTSLPILDFDDGFVQDAFGDAFLPVEMREQWTAWKKKLDDTKGESWADPILR